MKWKKGSWSTRSFQEGFLISSRLKRKNHKSWAPLPRRFKTNLRNRRDLRKILSQEPKSALKEKGQRCRQRPLRIATWLFTGLMALEVWIRLSISMQSLAAQKMLTNPNILPKTLNILKRLCPRSSWKTIWIQKMITIMSTGTCLSTSSPNLVSQSRILTAKPLRWRNTSRNLL